MLAVWSDRDGITDFDSPVGDNDTVDEQLEQGSLAVEVGRRQALSNALTKHRGVGGQLCGLAMALGLGLELLLLACEREHARLNLVAPPLVFGEGNDTIQIGLGKPLQLLLETGPAALEIGASRLQLLRQPMPAARPLDGLRDHLRMLQHLTEIAPD